MFDKLVPPVILNLDWTHLNWTTTLWTIGIAVIAVVLVAGTLLITTEWVPYALSKLRRILRFFKGSPPAAEVADARSLLDPTRIVLENHLAISVVCWKEPKTGGHAFLWFEWIADGENRKVRKFAKADFGYVPTVRGQQNLSDLVHGDGNIRIQIVEDDTPEFARARSLLHDVQSFEFTRVSPYRIPKDVDIETKINDLAKLGSAYSSLGNHPALNLSNSEENNNNCATWCAEVLRNEFGYVDFQFGGWELVRTPRTAVERAARN